MIIKDENSMARTILHYRIDPRFISCPRAYVVTGACKNPRLNKKNIKLLKKIKLDIGKLVLKISQ